MFNRSERLAEIAGAVLTLPALASIRLEMDAAIALPPLRALNKSPNLRVLLMRSL